MKRRILALCALAAVRATTLPAQSGAPPTLAEVVATTLRQNPDILAARLRADSAHAEQRIARALPNPQLSIAPQVPYQYSVAAPFDLGPQRLYRTRAAGRGLDAARADVEDVTRQVVFQVRQVFYDVLLAQAARDLAAEQRDIFRQLLAADSVRLRAGDVPQRNVTKSELELARAAADLTRAVAQLHAARLALQLLMGVAHPDTAFALGGELAYRPTDIPADSLLAIAFTNRPDIRAAQARIAQSRAVRGMVTAELLPTPGLALVYQNPGYSSGANYALGLSVTLPFPYWYGGERERSRAGLEAAEVERRRVEAVAANDVATALDAYRAARGLAETYESGLLARAQTALDNARYAYATGASSLLDLLDAIRTYIDTRSDYVTALHDYWVSVFALSRAVGRDFTP